MNMDKAASVARSKPNILPKLPFGVKGSAGYHVVEFLAPGFEEFAFADKYRQNKPTPALSIPVRLVDTDLGGVTLGDYQLTLRGSDEEELEGGKMSGLTARILALWSDCSKNLEGRTARIAWSDYENKQYGKTRGYQATLVPQAPKS